MFLQLLAFREELPGSSTDAGVINSSSQVPNLSQAPCDMTRD